jgi:sister-chromatid-cohesion protein PDS5
MDVDGDWKEDGQISDALRTKILSLKLCRHRCIAQAKSENPMQIADPVLKMLTTLLQHDGLLSDKITTRYSPSVLLQCSLITSASSPSERSRLRLQAAVSMAYLSAVDTYAQATTPYFVSLALTIQVAKFLRPITVLVLTHSAGYMLSCPFPFLNEDHSSPTYTGASLPVQRDSFLNGV